MNKIAKKPDPDIRTDTLVRFYLELADEPGRKRDKLHRAVLKMIEQGFWNPGDRLPTDSEFSQLLPLSVATVQAALAMLADQQVIVRKQKQGSFIMSEEHLSRDMVFFCFQHPDQDSDASVEFTSFSIFETEAPCPGEAFFGKDRPMLCISRDAEIAESFTVTSDVYLADPRIRILLDLDPDTLRTLGLRTLLQTRFGLPSVRFEWHFRTAALPADKCERLRVPEDTVGQIAETKVFTVNDEKLMIQKMWIPPSEWALFVKS